MKNEHGSHTVHLAKTDLPSRRSFLGVGAAFASALTLTSALSGCMKKGETDASQADDLELSYYIANPSSIDPYNAGDVNGNIVVRQLFDPLLEYDFQKQALVPVAAQDVPKVENHGTRFVFKIKQGRTFHNGEPVDAQSFVRAWTRMVNPKTGNSPSAVSYYLKLVKGYDALVSGRVSTFAGLSAPDAETFIVELSQPFEDFPMITTLTCTSPVPQAALEDFEAFFKAPIGNGAYEMDGAWEDGEYIRLKAYEDYQGTMPKIKHVNFSIMKDPETAYREFQAGDLDVSEVPTSQVRETEAVYGSSVDGYTITPGHQTLLGDEPSVHYLSFNLNYEPLKDIDVRRAISLAIDREAIVSTLFEGTRVAAGNLVAPGCEGYVEDQWAYAHFDRAAAEALLDKRYPKDESGMRGLKFILNYNQDGSNKEVMEAIQDQLKRVGIEIELLQQEWAAFVASVRAGDFQISRNGWIAEYPSIDNFLYSLCYTGNTDNLPRYSNKQVDEAITRARATEAEEERLALYENANKIVGEDVPYAPVFFYKMAKVGSSRIKRGYISPVEVESFATWEMQL